jgi:type IX secretion system PorP/SprF family membrane protein
MKKFLFISFICLFTGSLFGQSDVIYTHFMFNKLNYNPGFTGNPEVLDIGAIYRNQWWTGIEGAPKTLNIFAHSPLKDDVSAVGLSITSDRIGFYETLVISGSYAYRIEIDRDSRLSFGVSARMEQNRTNWALAQGVDPDIVQGETAQTNIAPNFGFGVYYKGKNYYAGLSAPRLLKNGLYSEGAVFTPKLNSYYAMAGMNFEISKNVEIIPNAMITYNPSAPFELDLNVNALFMQHFMAGVGYRLGDSFDFLVQYYFNKGFRLGAAMDFTTSALNVKTAGSFEILAGFTLPCKNCDIVHPIFL